MSDLSPAADHRADTAALEGGFADPVFDAQAVFAALMNAFARPGTIAELDERAQPPLPLPPAAGAVLATLADADTPVFLDGAAAAGPMGAWLGFHTGAPIVAEPEKARYALIAEPAAMPDLAAFSLGTDAYPDRSTTLILCLPDLAGGPVLRLTGPGLETEAKIAPSGLPNRFLADWHANRKKFPRGVDVILAAGGTVLALPRTTRIEEA
ncbi:phosphonate C-P lyase system protein PhnH [Aurantimonas sp. VKM B-3413]|uniref:phosphonate C-P lyase system protein PhnH n=1 Tax=Aurantimonas sp. VKM B-3413 TaxID=2779401 RepID=UPI001E34C446|nr:phosphonate C-P lyase system protein PhnH [Aurantimonas sp. VKM B-3413]MCB8837790.1 phosphonate C-P lyase system protein PhnH [Aurantimonas sp. VKM B-3413]